VRAPTSGEQEGDVTDEHDELGDLAAEAAEFGLPTDDLPAVARRSLDLADGATLSALVWGDASPQVALLHGGGLNAHTWNATIMAGGWSALALDLPGHGDSSWHADVDYGPERLAGPVVAALETWAPSTDVLVGQSLGGLAAIAVAAARPDLVRRLVVIDVSPGLVVGGGNQVRDFLAGPTDFASRDEIVERALSFGFGPTRAAVERGVLRNTRVRDDGRVVFKHHLANLDGAPAFATPDFSTLWPAYESIAAPVLLVRGERGFLSDELEAELVRRARDGRSITIASGHNVQEEAPVALADAISAFIG
jgi:pimeloyl-ACP methyl ester carboxylesterase